MKTSEFKAELKKLGYVFEDSCVTDKDNFAVACINPLYANVINSNHVCGVSPKLFNLIYKYATTPIAEREDEPKLFNVQIIKGNWGRASWLYRNAVGEIDTSILAANNYSSRQWTIEQIKEYGIDDETVYKRVPAEVEE